ncbi:MAG: methyl-accepting chemotaxis protein [Anaeromyxobacter sp.]
MARVAQVLDRISLRFWITGLVAAGAVATALVQWLVISSQGATRSALVGGLVVALISSALSFLALTRLLSPLRTLGAAARAISRGDLSAKVDSRGTAELGELANGMSNMTTRLQATLGELRQAALSTRTGAGGIQESVAHLAAMSAQQAAAVNETTTTASEIAQTSKAATAHADSVIEMTQRSDDLSREGLSTVEEAVKASASLGDQVNKIAAVMSELSERTQQVGEIIASVKDLAEQSNLLALNASIEASKAGEHGRGFSVVAMEMRNLAEQSKQAAVQIRAILQEIQRGAREAAAATDEGAKRAGAAVTLSRSAGDAIEGLASVIKESALAARQIAANTRQQTIGVEQIVSAISELSTVINESAERTRSIEQNSASLASVSEQLAATLQSYRV